MKNGRNLLYLMMIVIIGLGAFAIFKKTPKTVVGEQTMLGTPSGTTMTDLQSKLVESFKANDAVMIAQLCDEEIQFTHGETDDFLSREEVQIYFKDFFLALPTKKFAVIHSGSNQSGSGYYLIGVLESKDGKKMRVQISNNKNTIQSIEIDNEKDF